MVVHFLKGSILRDILMFYKPQKVFAGHIKGPDVAQACFIAAVPNLGYAYLQGYVINQKRYAKSLRLLMKMPSNDHFHITMGCVSFLFPVYGYANRKRLGTNAL